MLKTNLDFLKEKREKLRKEYNKNTNNEEIKKELLTVNKIITRNI
jgi:hypothetical protein